MKLHYTNWFPKNLKYSLALVTILFFAGDYIVEHFHMPTEVIAYTAQESDADKFNALWEEETQKVYTEMYKEARIRALTNITNRAGHEGEILYAEGLEKEYDQ